MEYFRNPAATITFVSMPAAGFIRLQWHPVPVVSQDVRAIYEHALKALARSGTTRLMSVHGQRPPLPAELVSWLAQEWIPRAIREAQYGQCAIVEAEQPMSRLTARSIGNEVAQMLQFAYFREEASAQAWLTDSVAG